MGILGAGFTVLMACGVVMLLAVAVAENSSPAISLVLGIYTMAIRRVVNATLDLFAIAYDCIRSIVPIYNAFAYILTQLIIRIVGPWVWKFADTIPTLFTSVAFAIISLVLSIRDWVQHITKCTNTVQRQCHHVTDWMIVGLFL